MGKRLSEYDKLNLSISRNDFIILYKKYTLVQLIDHLNTTESTLRRYLKEHQVTKNSLADDPHGNNPVQNIVVGTTKDNVKIYTPEEYEKLQYVKREIKSVDDFVNIIMYQMSKIKK